MAFAQKNNSAESDFRFKWYVLVAIGVGSFISTIDGTIITVSLPTLVEQLDTDFPTIQWVTLAYLLTVTVLLLSMGRLGDMIGKKRPYMVGVALFGAASAACGLAPNVQVLIAGRVVQAVGAAMLQSLGTAIITEAFPPEQRGQALGFGGLLVSAGLLTGPVLGGFLIENVGWRFIFWVNVPVTLVALYMVNRYVAKGRTRPDQKFDIVGAVLLGVGLASLMLALTFGQNWGWIDTRTLALFLMSAVASTSFVVVELRVEQPMVDLTLFRTPQFAISLALAVSLFILLSSRLIIPFFFELVQGLGPAKIGLILAVWPVAMALVAPLAGVLSDRIGSMKISLAGLVVSAVGYWVLARAISVDISPLLFAVLSAITGIGTGLFQSPNNSAVMGSVPKERLGLASGFLALTRNMGQLVGFAAIGALWATRTMANVPSELQDTITDASAAPPGAIAAGTAETILLIAILSTLLLGLGIWGVVIENRARHTVKA